MKIYIITEGEYSNYHIEGVFSTEEKAKGALPLLGQDETTSIKEWEVDDVPAHPPGMTFWCVTIDRQGDVSEASQESAKGAELYLRDKWRPYGDGRQVCFYQWATDQQHAIKIANELRAQLVAQNQWEVDWSTWNKKRVIQ